MHEANVIRGPGGCRSLFVNVSQAEICQRLTAQGGGIIIRLFPFRSFYCRRHRLFCLTKGPHQSEPSVLLTACFFFIPFISG